MLPSFLTPVFRGNMEVMEETRWEATKKSILNILKNRDLYMDICLYYCFLKLIKMRRTKIQNKIDNRLKIIESIYIIETNFEIDMRYFWSIRRSN